MLIYLIFQNIISIFVLRFSNYQQQLTASMALTPFQSTISDPFWDTNMMMPGMGGFGSQLGFPSQMGSQLGFPNIGSQMGFPNIPTPQLGMDLTEEADKWVVHADLPGYKDEDVELTIENGMLGVRGTRDKTVESDTGITHRVEVITTSVLPIMLFFIYLYLYINFSYIYLLQHQQRSFGEVRRAIRLPKGADQDNAQAHLVNGVLTVDFPKLALENVGKKIPLSITGGSTSSAKGKKKVGK